jgi:hypothetical protein
VTPSVASDGKTGWLVAWADFRSGTDYDVYAARVSPEGRVLDANGLAVATGRLGGPSQWMPAVAWSDGAYLLSWSTAPFLFMCRVTPDGKIAALPDEAGKLEAKAYNYGGPAGIGSRANDGANAFVPLAAGPDGCIAVEAYPVGKMVVSAGANCMWAFMLGRDGKPQAPANKEHLPRFLVHEEWKNPGWAVEPLKCNYEVFRMAHPSAAPLGRGFLVAIQRLGHENSNVAGSADRDDIVACRVQSDGACPDAKSAIAIDATPGYNKAWPRVCAGPEGECLVVYERDKAVGDCKIAARVVR